MSLLSDALLALQTDLKTYRGYLTFAPDYFSNNKQDVVTMAAEINEGGKLILAPDTSKYSDNALQAIFNISEISRNALGPGIFSLMLGSGGKQLRNNFLYLDENKLRVPKIVDETTYQAGKSLQQFLATILPKQGASEKEVEQHLDSLCDFLTATLGVRARAVNMMKEENVLKMLSNMQILLNTRIEFYDKVIQDDVLNQTLEFYQIKHQRRAIWDDTVGDESKKIQNQLQELSDKFNSIEEVEQALIECQHAIEALSAVNESWMKENEKLQLANGQAFPDTINIHSLFSHFFNVLVMGEMTADFFEYVIKDDLNNGISLGIQEKDVYEELMLSALNDPEGSTYQSGVKLVRTLNIQLQSLQARLKIATLYEQYKIEPQKLVTANTGDLEDDLKNNKKTLEELSKAKIQMLNSKKAFNNEIDSICEDDVFELNRAKIIKPYDDLFDGQYQETQALIAQVIKVVEKNEQAIAKMSSAGRQANIQHLGYQVNYAFKNSRAARVNYSKTSHAKATLDDSHVKTINIITEKYDDQIAKFTRAIEETEKRIQAQKQIFDDVPNQFEARHKQLRASLKKLEKFHQLAKASGSLYDLVGNVTTAELQQWFEIDDKHWLIHDHQQYTNENARHGVNFEFAFTWLGSKIFADNQDYKRNDKDFWLDKINERKRLISEELSARSIDNIVDRRPNKSESFGLYQLRQEYQQSNKQLPELNKTLVLLQARKEKLQAEKSDTLEIHHGLYQRAKEQKEESLAKYHQVKLSHEFSMQRLALTKLEYQTIEINEDWIEVEESANNILREEFDDLEFGEKIERLDETEQQLPRFFKIHEQAMKDLKKIQVGLSHLSKKNEGNATLNEFKAQHEELSKFYSGMQKTLDLIPYTHRQIACSYELERIKSVYKTLFEDSKIVGVDPAAIEQRLQDLKQYDDFVKQFNGSDNCDIELICSSIKDTKTQIDINLGYQKSRLYFSPLVNSSIFNNNKAQLRQSMPRSEFVVTAHDKLNTYIEQRRESYWFTDMLSNAAAIFLGCFGYQTESAKREEYIENLDAQLDAYKNNTSCFETLSATITTGIEKFQPRNGITGDCDKSLKTVLNQLTIALDETKPHEEQREGRSFIHV